MSGTKKSSFLGCQGRTTKAGREAYYQYSFQSNYRERKLQKRLFTADWKRETTFLGMWDKTVFLQERDLYLCKASKNRRER